MVESGWSFAGSLCLVPRALRVALAFAFGLCVVVASRPAVAQVTLENEGAVANARIFEGAAPTTNPGHLFAGRVGSSACPPASCTRRYRSLIRFDLSSIPANSKIIGVTVTMSRLVAAASDTTSRTVALHRVTGSWSEGNLAWPGPSINGSASATASVANGSAGSTLTITWSDGGLISDVQAWVNGTANRGWMLIGDESTATTMRRFGDRATAATAPKITVSYRRPLGSSCSAAAQCAHPSGSTLPGFCTNGVCCEVASCTGRCFSGTPSCQLGTGQCGPYLPNGAACTNQDSNPCTIETCNAAHECITTPAAAATVCRASAGPCDPAETCGGSTTCPADTILNGVPCPSGADSNPCTQDVCNGSASCSHPAMPAGTVCRPSSDPSCDPAEVCNGTTCPPNQSTCPGDICAANPPAGTVCRQATGECDVAETCSGTACPDDLPASSGTSCRAASCQSATVRVNPASCNGSSKSCPALTTTNCAPGICTSNACRQTCSNDNGCAPNAFCNGGTCEFKRPNGTPCTAANQCTSDRCVDGVCCNSACTGQCEACDEPGNVGTCSPVSGAPHGSRPPCDGDGSVCSGFCNDVERMTCTYPSNTTECTPASCSDGFATRRELCDGRGSCPERPPVPCAPYVCDVTQCYGECQTDGHCADGFFCLAGAGCVEKFDNGTACGGDNECSSGHCIDGVCCDSVCSGQCEACNVAGSEGTCSPVTGAPVGMRTPCVTDGSLCGGTCDGVVRTACTYPGPGVVCREGSCENGIATLRAECSGTGYCPPEFKQDCGNAGCSGDACDGDCDADSNCALNEFCSARICTPTLPNGSVCGSNSACASGICIDGVCCNSACTGQCEACDLPGSEGICLPVPAGEAPHGTRARCTSDGSACGGACDGSTRDRCTYPGPETTCREGSCAGGVAVLAATCMGNGRCPALREQACAPLSCNGDRCGPGGCVTEADCAAGEFCAAGLCVPKLVIGEFCGAHSDCITGNCVDGVCCDSACTGICEACDVVGSIGVCTPVGSGLPHGGRPSCSGVGVCASQCVAGDGSSCGFPGAEVECGGGSCRDGVQVNPPVCNGAGTCLAAGTQSCGAYACGDDACHTSCTTNEQCREGWICQDGACVSPGEDPDGGAGSSQGGLGNPGSGGSGTGGTSAGGMAGTDAVSGGGSSDGGSCGCRVPGPRDRAPSALLLAALAALAGLRRRRAA